MKMEGTQTQELELKLERTFEARAERVFDLGSTPSCCGWWAAGPDWTSPLAEVDSRPGGRYRLSMEDPGSGDVHTVAGEREVERPSRLVYTWTWEGESPEPQETVVTVEFHGDGDRTRVVLTHRGFGTDQSREQHEHGWNACRDNMGRRVFSS
jgi:uncharacterized protein YndB with AHSA1/START domain